MAVGGAGRRREGGEQALQRTSPRNFLNEALLTAQFDPVLFHGQTEGVCGARPHGKCAPLANSHTPNGDLTIVSAAIGLAMLANPSLRRIHSGDHLDDRAGWGQAKFAWVGQLGAKHNPVREARFLVDRVEVGGDVGEGIGPEDGIAGDDAAGWLDFRDQRIAAGEFIKITEAQNGRLESFAVGHPDGDVIVGQGSGVLAAGDLGGVVGEGKVLTGTRPTAARDEPVQTGGQFGVAVCGVAKMGAVTDCRDELPDGVMRTELYGRDRSLGSPGRQRKRDGREEEDAVFQKGFEFHLRYSVAEGRRVVCHVSRDFFVTESATASPDVHANIQSDGGGQSES